MCSHMPNAIKHHSMTMNCMLAYGMFIAYEVAATQHILYIIYMHRVIYILVELAQYYISVITILGEDALSSTTKNLGKK